MLSLPAMSAWRIGSSSQYIPHDTTHRRDDGVVAPQRLVLFDILRYPHFQLWDAWSRQVPFSVGIATLSLTALNPRRSVHVTLRHGVRLIRPSRRL